MVFYMYDMLENRSDSPKLNNIFLIFFIMLSWKSIQLIGFLKNIYSKQSCFYLNVLLLFYFLSQLQREKQRTSYKFMMQDFNWQVAGVSSSSKCWTLTSYSLNKES